MKKWWSFWIKSLLLSIQMTQITYIQKNYNYKKTFFNFYFRIGNAKFLFLLVNTQNLFVFCGCSRKHSSCIKLYTVNTPPHDEEPDCIHWLDGVNIPFIWLKKHWKFDPTKGCASTFKCLVQTSSLIGNVFIFIT